MIGIPIALAAFNAGEWVMHRYVLHGLGKSRRSFFAYHFHEHHREARQNGGYDTFYHRSLLGWHPQTKEALGLAALGALHLPLAPVAPFYTATVLYSLVRYYRVHRRAHLDPAWARHNLTWHYDHHMGPDQEANWCVTQPWFDYLMGTRVRYVGTPREARDRDRNAERAEAAARAAEPGTVAAPVAA